MYSVDYKSLKEKYIFRHYFTHLSNNPNQPACEPLNDSLYLITSQKSVQFLVTNLCCTSFPQKFNNGGDCVASDDGVINQHHALPSKVVCQHPKLLSDSQLPQAGIWLNKCSPNVAVLTQNLCVGKTRLGGQKYMVVRRKVHQVVRQLFIQQMACRRTC